MNDDDDDDGDDDCKLIVSIGKLTSQVVTAKSRFN